MCVKRGEIATAELSRKRERPSRAGKGNTMNLIATNKGTPTVPPTARSSDILAPYLSTSTTGERVGLIHRGETSPRNIKCNLSEI
jgi:hypothetical protein